MATRKSFNADDDSIANAIPHIPVKRYECAAHRCPMAGTISGEGGSGICAYHYNTHSGDWPRITQVLLDWAVVTEEINHCRTVLCNPATAANPAAIAEEFAKAAERVLQGAGSWTEDLKPQLTRGNQMDSYGSWTNRLECFIGQRVVEAMRHRIGRKAA